MARETLCLDFFKECFPHFFTKIIKAHITHKFVRRLSSVFLENTLEIHLRVRDCKPTIICTISLSFPLILPLQLQILERFTRYKCLEKFWHVWEVLEEAIDRQMQFGTNCGIQITSEDMAW